MLRDSFDAGGPVMWLVLGLWVVVLGGALDRCAYLLGRAWRRPGKRVVQLVAQHRGADARALFEREERLAERGLARIESLSQLATSLGLFGTVLGIARAFFARGDELGLAAPEVLASGLATALFTTLAGLVVFLFGQGFLIAFGEWLGFLNRPALERLVEQRP